MYGFRTFEIREAVGLFGAGVDVDVEWISKARQKLVSSLSDTLLEPADYDRVGPSIDHAHGPGRTGMQISGDIS